MTETQTAGQVAQAAWNQAHGNPTSFPTWDQLSPVVRAKWEYVADALIRELLTSGTLLTLQEKTP
jgi:hypothetical protein